MSFGALPGLTSANSRVANTLPIKVSVGPNPQPITVAVSSATVSKVIFPNGDEITQ
jgi:hypothetical protein